MGMAPLSLAPFLSATDLPRIKLESNPVDFILTTNKMLEDIREYFPADVSMPESYIPVIILVGISELQAVLPRVGQDIDDVIVKPLNTDQLSIVLERVKLERHMQQTLAKLKATIQGLQEENDRLKSAIESRIPGGVDAVLHTVDSRESDGRNQHGALRSYAEHKQLEGSALPDDEQDKKTKTSDVSLADKSRGSEL